MFPRVSYLFWTNKQTAVFSRQPLVEGDEKRREERAHARARAWVSSSSLVELLVDYVVPRERLFVLFLSLTADISFAPLAAKKRNGVQRQVGQKMKPGERKKVKSLTS